MAAEELRVGDAEHGISTLSLEEIMMGQADKLISVEDSFNEYLKHPCSNSFKMACLRNHFAKRFGDSDLPEKCSSCNRPDDGYLVRVEGDWYHKECMECAGCKKRISRKEVDICPDIFLSRPANRVSGNHETWHANCYGCQCAECVKIRASGGEPEMYGYCEVTVVDNLRSSTMDHCRVYNGVVLDPQHRLCNDCKLPIGSKGTDGRDTTSTVTHDKCEKCGECIGADQNGVYIAAERQLHIECFTCHVCNEKRPWVPYVNIHEDGTRTFILDSEKNFVHNDCIRCTICEETKRFHYVALFKLPIKDMTEEEKIGYDLIDPAHDVNRGAGMMHRSCKKDVKRKCREAYDNNFPPSKRSKSHLIDAE